jgi:RNA polymerase sigma-70 factor (ECF subfamily)
MPAGASDSAFRTLFEPHRRPITLHCYRMLGSLQDAEEVVQETLLRAWQRRDEVRSSGAQRAWLYQIATNACLDQLRKAGRRQRALPHLVGAPSTTVRIGPPLEEQFWLEPAPDALLDIADEGLPGPDERASRRESIVLSFIAALQLLSPKQRAALLLVDVLGWTPQETAALLDTSVPSVNSLLQRARKSVAAARDEPPPPPVSESDSALLGRFIGAWEQGDLQAFTALLADDALFSMPPQAEWYRGREAIGQFFAAIWAALPGQRRLLPLAANGGLGVAVYNRSTTPDALFQAGGITLVTFRDGQISLIIRFGVPRLFPSFGLPLQLTSAEPSGRAPCSR